MRTAFYSLVILISTLGVIACSNDDHDNFPSSTANIDTRAASLGFDSVEAYKNYVAEQCAAGNHENCDIYADGTHQPCVYADHSGKNHDGTHHNGTDHGTHDNNGNHQHNGGKHH